MEMASTVVQGDLLRSVESIAEVPKLALPISRLRWLLLCTLRRSHSCDGVSGKSSEHGECRPKADGGCGGFCFFGGGGRPGQD